MTANTDTNGEAAMNTKKFFVVLAPCGEGFVTDDANDAAYAATGCGTGPGFSTLAESFRDAYAGEVFTVREVELPA